VSLSTSSSQNANSTRDEEKKERPVSRDLRERERGGDCALKAICLLIWAWWEAAWTVKKLSALFSFFFLREKQKKKRRPTLDSISFLLGGRFSPRRGEKVTLTGLCLGLSLHPLPSPYSTNWWWWNVSSQKVKQESVAATASHAKKRNGYAGYGRSS